MRHKSIALLGVALFSILVAALAWRKGSANATEPPSRAAVAASRAATSTPGISVEVVVLDPRPLEVQVPATGRLLAREAVEIVSELSRRLVRVRAVEGTAVKKGDVLFELDAQDIEAELSRLEVQARLAKATLDRTAKLLGEGIANQQDFDLARARYDELSAQRRLSEVTLSRTLIRAPFAGELGLRRVSEGAMVSPNTVLATLQDTSSFKLDFTLPERYAGLVQNGGVFRFHVEGRGERFTGRIIAQEPLVDRSTRSLLVRGVVEGSPELMPGASASIDVPLRVEQALLVPAIAVVPGADGRRVFVAEDGVARSVPVELGARTTEHVQVLSGLSPGARVITSNLLRLSDGARVTVGSEPAPR